jgi:hypothetical protein
MSGVSVAATDSRDIDAGFEHAGVIFLRGWPSSIALTVFSGGPHMKEVYSSSSPLYCWVLKGILESEGIECEVQNENLGPIAGAIPLDQTWPRLCVVSDGDADRAKRIIDDHKPKLGDIPSFCPNCDSEEIELEESGNLVTFDRFRCRKCHFSWHKG